MGCNCKNDGTPESTSLDLSIGKKIIHYTLKTLMFLFMVALLPIIIVALIWFMFRTIVLTKEIDIKPMLLALGNKFKVVESDVEYEDDYDELTEDDVVMLGVVDITNKSK